MSTISTKPSQLSIFYDYRSPDYRRAPVAISFNGIYQTSDKGNLELACISTGGRIVMALKNPYSEEWQLAAPKVIEGLNVSGLRGAVDFHLTLFRLLGKDRQTVDAILTRVELDRETSIRHVEPVGLDIN